MCDELLLSLYLIEVINPTICCISHLKICKNGLYIFFQKKQSNVYLNDIVLR